MAWRDALHLEVLGGVACQFEHLSSQVFEDGSKVDGGFGADARLLARDCSEVTLYATARELYGRHRVSASWLRQASKASKGRMRGVG